MKTLFSRIVVALALLAGSPALADDTPSLKDQTAKAEAGDLAAMVGLGDGFQNGTFGKADPAQALYWYEKAAALNDINAAYMAGVLRRLRSQPGDHEKSLAHLLHAMDLCKAPTASCTLRYLKRELAMTYLEMTQYDKAMALTLEVKAEAQQATPPDDAMIGQANTDTGSIQYSLGQYDQAMTSYNSASVIYEKLYGAESPAMAQLMSMMGNALERSGKYNEAIAVERKALGIVTAKLGPRDEMVGVLLNNIGWALKGLGKYDDAFAALEQSLPIMREKFGPTSDKVTYMLANMGIVREKQGRYREAISLNMRALGIMRNMGPAAREPMRWALESLSNSYAALGDRKTAILFAKLAVNTQQQIRRDNAALDSGGAESLAKDWQRLYRSLADLLIAEGRIAEAQYTLDLLKQQELIEFVRRDASSDAKSGTAALTSHEQTIEAQFDEALKGPMALAAELDALTAKEAAGSLTEADKSRIKDLNAALDESYQSFATDIEALLDKAHAESGNVQDEVKALDLDYAADRQDMLRQFPRPTVLLQAASLSDGLHLFLTTKDISIHREVHIARADLAKKVFDVLDAIEARSPEADAQLAELYGLLVKPLEADLKQSGAEVVMLNLGGFLRYLPFAALKSDHGYFIEDYALAIDTPAARTKFEAANRADADAAGFGVTAAHAGFSPLPGVAKELEASLKGSDAQGELPGSPLLDSSFTEDSLKEALKRRPKLLHLASHFRFVPGNETDSFLLLGNGDPLTLEQIRKGRGFRFGGVDLLTLSACETAKGGDAEGDEVESFGAIAQMNGASAVMATLWPIADEASGKLMADFYRGLVIDGLDKADALRRAQIAMLRGVPLKDVSLTSRGATDGEPQAAPAAPADVTTRHPYYWSPYILMGNWL